MNKPGPRPTRMLKLTALASALTLTLSSQGVHAQAAEPAKPAAGLERAQKAADAVFHWIKLNGEKGATRQGGAPAPAPAAVPAPSPPPPAPRKPVQAAAPRPAPQAPAPTQAPEPPAVAVAQPVAPLSAAPAPAATAAVEPEPERSAVVVAAAAPTPMPTAPLAAAQPAPPPTGPEEPQLKLLTKVEPTIPRQLLTQMIRNGFAQVQFTVAPDGTVSKAQVLKASHARLGNAAVDAIKQWRFAPIARARDAAVEVAFNNNAE